MKRSDFFYDLPPHLIAQNPLTERTASRLLVLDKRNGECEDKHFIDLTTFVTEKDLLVFNDTKVIPARLFGQKETGGKIELLVERLLDQQRMLCHLKSSKAPKVDALLQFDGGVQAKVLGRKGSLFDVNFDCESLLEYLEKVGHIPLPPYITREDNQHDEQRYQTVYADKPGAVAAPTAGLHFDQALLKKLKQQGVDMAYITLHVGAGTFQPVRADDLSEHVMHSEYINVDQGVVDQVSACKARGGRVIAVGTTAVRSLESAAAESELMAFSGDTDLFITPGYQFKVVDAMITNFHLPESTLLMLVSAFSGYSNIFDAYRHAVENEYRFFSYGDAMLLL